MFNKFWRDQRGNYAMMTAVFMVPLMGGLALGLDYTEMNRQRQATLNALDAAGIAAARRIVDGATDDVVKAYAKDFFESNLINVDPNNIALSITLPANNTGGGTLKMSAKLKYEPWFFGAFTNLLGTSASGNLEFAAATEIRLKNTLEVALVLDNSGSMNYLGSGSATKRIDLLKAAAKQLIDTLAAQAIQMKQVTKPVQFSLVPFAASVNIGPQYSTANWMDIDGLSPIHHENFDWATMNAANANKKVDLSGGVYYKKGAGWGTQENQKVTRFSLFSDLQRITGSTQVQTGTTTQQQCTTTGWGWSARTTCVNVSVPVYTTVPVYGSYAGWQGCVEARPYPYNNNDAAATSGTPATLFVPMFAPDETDYTSNGASAENSYWADGTSSTDSAVRQRYMPKYFTAAVLGTSAAAASTGPNASCTTTPITPLTDVTVSTGLTAIKAAIDAMGPNGATNVPEGLAWGWRTISSKAPFSEGRLDTEKGNDKVVIVLTDGANTYYTPGSLGYNDLANNKSIYSNYGYAGKGYNGTATSRLFMNTLLSTTDYSNTNYTNALNAQLQDVCTNAKAANVLVMTVALDLSTTDTADKAQIAGLTTCSSNSRFRKDPTDPTKPAKLFWNATGATLSDKFKEIADELSNLRIVG